MLILETAKQCSLGVWNGNLKWNRIAAFVSMCITNSEKCISFCLFNTKRYAAYLYTLPPLEKQVRLAFSCSVPLEADRTSRSKNVKNASYQNLLQILNGAYMRYSLWKCRSRNIFLFSSLFVSGLHLLVKST